ncbi:MAG: hypothetical protein ACLQPD_24830 [Desulfomonilaceae bacterium]
MIAKILLTVLYPLGFATIALYFIVIGLRGIFFRKPFVISWRWFVIPYGLAFGAALPPFIGLLGMGGGTLGIVLWLYPATFILIGVFLYIAMRGYTAFGTTDVSFREGLLASLERLSLPYEEKLSAVRLPTIEADLQVAVQSWLGTAQLKMKQRKFSGVLSDIVKGMNECYQSGTASEMNLTACVFYAVIGVMVAVFAGRFFLAFYEIF